MKVRIYPKIRWYDDRELEAAFIPSPISKAQLSRINQYISEYSISSDKFVNLKDKIVKEFSYDRDKWNEIKFGVFSKWLIEWFGKVYKFEVKDKFIECDVDVYFIENHLKYIDHQVYDSTNDKWLSGNKY